MQKNMTATITTSRDAARKAWEAARLTTDAYAEHVVHDHEPDLYDDEIMRRVAMITLGQGCSTHDFWGMLQTCTEADFHGTRLSITIDGEFDTKAGITLSSTDAIGHIQIKREAVAGELQRRIDTAARMLIRGEA
jgi:hypothetical protein